MENKSRYFKICAIYFNERGSIYANIKIIHAPEGLKFDLASDSPGLSISEFNEKYKNSLEPLEFIIYFVNEKTGQSTPLGLDIRKGCPGGLEKEKNRKADFYPDISDVLKKIGL